MEKERLDNIIGEGNANLGKIGGARPIYGKYAGPINTGDEEIERVRKIYEMSVFLLKNDYHVGNYGQRETIIKTGIKQTMKTGIYGILLIYEPSDPEFHTAPRFKVSLLNLFGNDPHNLKSVLNLRFYPSPGYLKAGLSTEIVLYEPGKWEEILSKKYQEKAEEDKYRNYPIEYKGQMQRLDDYPKFYMIEGDKEVKL